MMMVTRSMLPQQANESAKNSNHKSMHKKNSSSADHHPYDSKSICSNLVFIAMVISWIYFQFV